MELRNLTTFVQVAELSSFTRAAQVLDYSQSTVSFQIKQLERELDCLLFERINHTLILTQRGRELLSYAQRVLQLTEEFHQESLQSQDPCGHVHIVTPDCLCKSMLLDHYADFRSLYPHITLQYSTANTDEMLRMLGHNEADLMMTLDSHLYRADYVIAKENRISVHFVTDAQSPLCGKKLCFADIANEPFILTEKGMGYRRVLEERLAQLNYDIQPILEVGRTDLISNLLGPCRGISFLPDFVTQRKVAEGSLAYLEITDVHVEIWQQLIYHRSKWMSRALQSFIDYLKEKEFSR